LAVYRFRDPALRCALLDQPDDAAQQAAERELLEFLGARMAVATRSIAQLFVNLTERVQFDLSAGPRQRLRLWVGQAEHGALATLLRGEISAGRLPAEALLRTALQDQTLPAYPRLALLDAAVTDESTLPHERRVMLAGVRTELLCATGRLADALVSADHGLSVLALPQQPEPHGIRGLLLFLRANCQRQLGQLVEALQSFKLAAAEAAKPRPDGSVDAHNRGVCLAEAGHCHAERSEWEPAAALLREAIAVLRSGAGDARVRDEQIAQLEHNLAVCEAKLQEAAAPAIG
jgi:tetratricopeptide (TPR) repeat protein